MRFDQLNLIDDWAFAEPFDAISCRNVMIYFDVQTQQRLVERFCDHLQPGGFLFLDSAEGLVRLETRFRMHAPSIYRRPMDT